MGGGRISGLFVMGAEIESRILCLLRGRYFEHEVASIIAVEYPHLNEYDVEDLPKHIDRIKRSL